jgi:hypothetical protein
MAREGPTDIAFYGAAPGPLFNIDYGAPKGPSALLSMGRPWPLVAASDGPAALLPYRAQKPSSLKQGGLSHPLPSEALV